MSQMGSQMEMVVVVWYVLNLTDSPFLVGLTAAARLGFNFLALFAGATADIVPRRTLMIIVQAVLASMALVMLTLIVTGLIEVWHIFIVTLGAGLARIFQMPTIQSLAVDSVSTDRIPNAVALINAGSNIALVLGPILGGLLFDIYGPEGAYVLVASLYILSGSATVLIGATRVSASVNGEPRSSRNASARRGRSSATRVAAGCGSNAVTGARPSSAFSRPPWRAARVPTRGTCCRCGRTQTRRRAAELLRV